MTVRPLQELIRASFFIHGHRCAGQVLGVRMAIAGCREVGIDEPRGCKNLLVYVEIDRCVTDALQTVTGCSLGKRTLKFLDYGKMAATFVNLDTEKAVRVLVQDDARLLVPEYSRHTTDPRKAQKLAYTVMPEDALFAIQPTTVHTSAEKMPGYRGIRVYCARCGEGINFRREVKMDGQTLCIPCARGRCLPQNHALDETLLRPKVVLIVGYKKTGKTSFIERLIPELSGRGYRVGTIKHHHSDAPVETDRPGTDSWRHRKAGARRTAFITPKDAAVFFGVNELLSLDRMVDAFTGLDIVLVEGFHREAKPRIEIRSAGGKPPRCARDENLLAIVEKTPSVENVPSFSPGDVKPLVDLIERKILKPR